jgi:cation/acetate symporter
MTTETGIARVGTSLGALLIAILCAAGAILALLAAARQVGIVQEQLDVGYFALAAAVAVLIALCARWLAQGRDHRSLAAPAADRGLALAADTVSGAFFLALSGVVFAWGHDGLSFALGLGAGYLLLQLLIAPALPASGARSLPEFFVQRYGRFVAVLAGVAIILSMAAFLVAQLMAGGIVGARLLGLDYQIAVAAAGALLLVCFVLRGMTATPLVRAVLFLMMLITFLAPAVLISMERFGLPLPQAAYGDALGQIRDLELTLLEQELADPAVMVPMLTPFLELSPLNFLGIVLGLAAGLAALPHVLSRHLVVPPVRDARWSAVWALLFAGLFLTAAPALAAFVKLSVLTLVSGKTALADLPAWVFAYGKMGLVEICGRPAIDAAAAVAACAAVPDAGNALRLQDLALSPDMIALAAPEIAGLDHALFGWLAAAALAAAVVTADGPLFALTSVFGLDGRAAGTARAAAYLLAAVAVALAGFAAALRPSTVLTMATWAFVLAAAGLFPAVVAGLWWRRASAPAAALAIVAGLALSLYYLVASQYFPVAFYETWPMLSNSGDYTREMFDELSQVWEGAPPGAAKDTAWVALQAQARDMANWWGIRPIAVALLAVPGGLALMILVSLVVPRRQAAETAS